MNNENETIEDLKKKVNRLTQGLEFYSNPSIYTSERRQFLISDAGLKARTILNLNREDSSRPVAGETWFVKQPNSETNELTRAFIVEITDLVVAVKFRSGTIRTYKISDVDFIEKVTY